MEIDFKNFREIDGFDGMYFVDINGNVFSKYVNRFLKQNIYHGYWRVILFDKKNKKHISKYVHRLIATYFISNPNNYLYVNHKDENKLNNNIENLEWCTATYNNTYNNVHLKRGCKIKETIKKKGGAYNKGVKMSEEQKEKDK
jgi:hypothetical protein